MDNFNGGRSAAEVADGIMMLRESKQASKTDITNDMKIALKSERRMKARSKIDDYFFNHIGDDEVMIGINMHKLSSRAPQKVVKGGFKDNPLLLS